MINEVAAKEASILEKVTHKRDLDVLRAPPSQTTTYPRLPQPLMLGPCVVSCRSYCATQASRVDREALALAIMRFIKAQHQKPFLAAW
jgi:hypothetical protein